MNRVGFDITGVRKLNFVINRFIKYLYFIKNKDIKLFEEAFDSFHTSFMRHSKFGSYRYGISNTSISCIFIFFYHKILLTLA